MMFEWIYQLPVVWMALIILAITWLGTWAIHATVMALAKDQRARAFKAITPGLLSPLGIVFGLLVVFLSAQVWNDSQRAGAEVLREASALRAVVLLAETYPEDSRAALRDLVRRQIQHAAEEEWPAMARQNATLAVAPPALSEALHIALRVTPQGEGQAVAQREIVAALENALDARRQRIIISRSSINWVKWTGLIAQAIVTLLAIAMVHSDNRAAAAMAMGLFATAVALSIVLIAAHARPFSGQISVRPAVLQEVLPEQEQRTP